MSRITLFKHTNLNNVAMIDVRLESLGLKVTLGLVKQSLSSVLEKGS